jgi:hypothetical protein
MASKLIIRSHHPWRYRAKIAAAALALLLAGWGMFEYGQSSAGYDNDSLHQAHALLQDQVQQEKKTNQQLRDQIAILQRASQVDKQAYAGVETSLKQIQDEMLELKEEVAFYRGIVSPSEAESGLNIADFKLTGIGEERVFRFKLVLTQLKSNVRLVKGYAQVVIEGVKDGAQVQLSLKQVTGGALDKIKLRFKYFQNQEGEVVLPEGFLPSRVLIEVVPSVKGMNRFKKTFDWSDIVGE